MVLTMKPVGGTIDLHCLSRLSNYNSAYALPDVSSRNTNHRTRSDAPIFIVVTPSIHLSHNTVELSMPHRSDHPSSPNSSKPSIPAIPSPYTYTPSPSPPVIPTKPTLTVQRRLRSWQHRARLGAPRARNEIARRARAACARMRTCCAKRGGRSR